MANQTPTLLATVKAASLHVVVDDKAHEIVLDARALYRGVLGAGFENPAAPNAAAWFVTWLSIKLGGPARIARVLEAQTGIDTILRGLDEGFAIVSSPSVKAALTLAAENAMLTVGRARFDMRHLLAALIKRRVVRDMTARVFDVALSDDDLDVLKLTLYQRIMATRETNESGEAWRKVLELEEAPVSTMDAHAQVGRIDDSSNSSDPSNPGNTANPNNIPSPNEAPRPPPEETISPFNGDAPSVGGEDVLDTKQDIEALAQLVCLEGAAPLAVAIFGDWGSGKSTFMAGLEARVDELAREEAKSPAPAEATRGVARFVHPVVQIRFNAWHFADANLWASLTAEFFDQLRAGGYKRTGKVRHAQLVEEVNRHVHGLSKAASDNRQALAANGAAVLKAQEAVDDAAKTVRKISGNVLTKTAINLLGETYVAQKRHLAALGLNANADEQGRAAEVVVGVAKDLTGLFGSLRAFLGVLFKTHGWRWILVAVALGVATAWLGHAYPPPRLDPKWLDRVVQVLAWAVGAVVAVAKAIGPTVAIVRDVARRGVAVIGEIDGKNQKAAADLLAKDIALKKALNEADALEEAEAASARALARYVDPQGTANPPRLLRYVLEDDPDTKALEKDIGLIGRTRRLFQAVDEISRDVRAKRRAGDTTDAETPERIVLYIDDLDRCTEAQVYQVLQAVHLLLAFELFVVVVGVDVAWVQEALTHQFDKGEAGDDEQANALKRRDRAIAYLEKIFQVPFWLRPLSSAAKGTYERYVRSLAGPSAEAVAEAEIQAEAEALAKSRRSLDATNFAEAQADEASDKSGEAAAAVSKAEGEDATSTDTPPPLAEVRRTIQLARKEIDFLASPAIATVAAAAPRGVKRLVNIYRIARARRGQDDAEAVLGEGGKLPEYPLLILMAAIETGQTVKVAEDFQDALRSIAAKGREGQKSLMTEKTGKLSLVGLTDLSNAVNAGRGLKDAMESVAKARGGALNADDLLAAARLVRRYSFNRYR